MTPLDQNLAESTKFIREHLHQDPTIAVVLGSGLGDFVDSFESSQSISTNDIPHFARSTVEGHRGKIVVGHVLNKSVLAFQGRVHLYESGSVRSVLYPIKVAHALGIRKIIMTNAAGGVGRQLSPGSLMIISDHLNLLPESIDQMNALNTKKSRVYSDDLNQIALRCAAELHMNLEMGVYAGVKGPSYETAAEVEMIHRLGGDAVGMSTVLEASLGARLGMDVLGISCITNMGTGITGQKLDHSEVTEVASRVKKDFSSLLRLIISRL